MKCLNIFFVFILLSVATVAHAVDDDYVDEPVNKDAGIKVSLVAIFKNKVIVKINGKQVVLEKDKPGPQGVVLRFADTRSESADIEIAGKLETMPLGYVMSGGTTVVSTKGKQRVTLYSGSNGFFHADGYINSTPVKFLVDTGANTIALNSSTARRIGIDYKKGKRAMAVTASGYIPTYVIDLEQVEVGGLKLNYVAASVIEGPQPSTPLLGMSFLGAFDMKREGDRMELIQR